MLIFYGGSKALPLLNRFNHKEIYVKISLAGFQHSAAKDLHSKKERVL